MSASAKCWCGGRATTTIEAGATLVLNTLKKGDIREQTMRAFTAAEMEKILEKVT
jgi:uncharacterized protein with GYD domain